LLLWFFRLAVVERDIISLYFFGSLGFAVMNRQFWRQLHCRPPAVQLLGQLSRRFPMNHFFSKDFRGDLIFVNVEKSWPKTRSPSIAPPGVPIAGAPDSS
jgi:hypothetical protein